MKIYKFFSVLLGIVLIVGLGWFFYNYIKEGQRREKRDDLVWLARCELETLRNDKSIQYLRLKYISHEDDLLKLTYETSMSSSEVAKIFKDSLMYKDFMSVVVLHPDKWNNIAQYLSEARVDLSIAYLNNIGASFIIPWKQLLESFSDEQLFEDGMELFVKRKKQEVLNYARLHFRKDRYFRVDSLSLEKDFVALHLSYNDSRAILGSAFTNTEKVAIHYTDKVGDMGSILDNMLSICARTNKGFAFVYKAQKNRKVQRCEWSAEKAKEIYENTADRLWLDNRETNQVSTVIYRTK